jgi:hypothetical protein
MGGKVRRISRIVEVERRSRDAGHAEADPSTIFGELCIPFFYAR